jgi:hypothetical protein
VVLDELRHAVRTLGRAPRFVCACVVTLALALAGTATLLNLLETFVFRKLAVPAPEQLVGIYPVRAESSVGFTPATLTALRARQRTLTASAPSPPATARSTCRSVPASCASGRSKPSPAIATN